MNSSWQSVSLRSNVQIVVGGLLEIDRFSKYLMPYNSAVLPNSKIFFSISIYMNV